MAKTIEIKSSEKKKGSNGKENNNPNKNQNKTATKSTKKFLKQNNDLFCGIVNSYESRNNKIFKNKYSYDRGDDSFNNNDYTSSLF